MIYLKDMTDVVGGKMTLNQLRDEIEWQMINRSPDKIVIEIMRNKKVKGYYSRIWIPVKDFKKKIKYHLG